MLDWRLFARLDDAREAAHWWMIDCNEACSIQEPPASSASSDINLLAGAWGRKRPRGEPEGRLRDACWLGLRLLDHSQRVLNLDPQVPHRALYLDVVRRMWAARRFFVR